VIDASGAETGFASLCRIVQLAIRVSLFGAVDASPALVACALRTTRFQDAAFHQSILATEFDAISAKLALGVSASVVLAVFLIRVSWFGAADVSPAVVACALRIPRFQDAAFLQSILATEFDAISAKFALGVSAFVVLAAFLIHVSRFSVMTAKFAEAVAAFRILAAIGYRLSTCVEI